MKNNSKIFLQERPSDRKRLFMKFHSKNEDEHNSIVDRIKNYLHRLFADCSVEATYKRNK